MSNRRSAIHYWLRALILAGFSFYIVHLIQQDSLNYYIAPRMEIYVKLTAFGLYAVAAFQAIRGWKEWHATASVSCDCEHHLPKTRLGSIVTYGFFLVPLLLGFFTPDTLLGSTYAAQKGMNYSGANYFQLVNASKDASTPQSAEAVEQPVTEASSDEPAAGDEISTTDQGSNRNEPSGYDNDSTERPVSSEDSHEQSNESTDPGADTGAANDPSPPVVNESVDDELAALFTYDIFTEYNAKHAMELYQQDVIEIPEITFMETLTSLDLYKESFVGKKLKITGFVYREDTMNESQFAVSRIAMTCCSADSMPFGVLAEYARASQFADDTWVEVVGEVDVTNFNGYDLMTLKVTSIETVPAPDSPYVYPNFEFGL